MKILRKTVIILLLLTGGVIGSGLLISHFYGDEVKEAVIKRLNERLQVEVDVEEVDFSALRKFPYASVSFFQTRLRRDADTLFHFDEVHLQFDWIDLVKGQQRIDRISFENGHLLLPIDSRGEHPYDDIWKKESPNKESDSRFELDRLEWENVSFRLDDRNSRTAFRTRIAYAFLQGSFSEDRSELRARVNGTWNELDIGKRAWKEIDRKYEIRTNGTIDNTERLIRIEESKIEWDRLKGEVKGKIQYGQGSRLDLNYRFPSQDIHAYMNAWPGLFEKPSSYELAGKIRTKGSWKGRTGIHHPPVLKGDVELEKARIEHEGSGISAKDLRAKGSFRTRNDEGRPQIELDAFKGRFGGGKWSGKGHLSFGSSYGTEIHLKGKSDLRESMRFLGIDTLKSVSGEWETDLRLKGWIDDPSRWTPEQLKQLSISGRASLKDATFAIRGDPHEFQKLNGEFILHGMNAAIDELEGSYAGNRVQLEGRFYQLLPYLFFPNRKLRVQAELSSKSLHLDPVLNSKSSSTSENYALKFPEDLRFDLKTDLDTLRFRRFEAHKLSGNIQLGPGGLTGKNISMKLAGGRLAGQLALNGSSRPYGIRAGAQLKGIHIKPFFQAFESFGQDFVRPEHLGGVLDAEVHYKSSLEKDLTIPPASVTSSTDLEIRKGELKDFHPLINLGERLAKKKVLNSFLDLEKLAEKLQHVRFETLKNKILVENEKVILPRFDVHSNALDIIAHGEHHFDGTIDHHFVILLDELLSKPKKSEFGYLRDEGEQKRLFVKMSGTTENPEISFDKKAAKKHRKKQRKEEKEEVKDVLRKEFGLFGGKDSVASPEEEEEKEKGEPAFDVQWGEEKEGKKEKKEKEEEDGKSLWQRIGIGDDEDKDEKKKEDE